MLQRSAKWRKAVSNSMKRRWKTKSWRKKMAKAVSNRDTSYTKNLWTDNMKREQSRVAKKRTSNPKWKAKTSKRMKKYWASHPMKRANMRKLMSRRAKRYWKDPKFRAFKIAKVKEQWKDPKFAQKVLGNIDCPSKPQKSLFRKLCRAGVSGLKLEHRVGKYAIDIVHIPTKTAIEVDGAYWHHNKDHSSRDKLLKQEGWKVKRFLLEKHNTKKQISNFFYKIMELLK